MTKVDDPIAVEGVRFKDRWLTVEDGVRLQVFEWHPECETGADPILFVAGWISLVTGWRPLLEKMVETHPVYYIETREKCSAEIDRRLMRTSGFSIPRLAEDLIEASAQLGLDDGRTVLFGSSMGSNAILEALKHGRLQARAAFLVGPNIEFHFPAWGRVAVHVVPAWLIQRLKGFVIWYLQRFRVNAKDDPEQMARYVRTVRAADAARLKLSAKAVQGYTVLPGLETITAPVAVAYAGSDILHGESEVRSIVDAIPAGTAVLCPSNSYMHTAAVAEEFEAFLTSVNGRGAPS